MSPLQLVLLYIREDTVRYAGLLLATAEGFGLRPRAFFVLRAKREPIMLFWPILGNFLCPVESLVTFNSNLSNFKRIKKSQNKIPKKSEKKNTKNTKNYKKKIYKESQKLTKLSKLVNIPKI